MSSKIVQNPVSDFKKSTEFFTVPLFLFSFYPYATRYLYFHIGVPLYFTKKRAKRKPGSSPARQYCKKLIFFPAHLIIPSRHAAPPAVLLRVAPQPEYQSSHLFLHFNCHNITNQTVPKASSPEPQENAW